MVIGKTKRIPHLNPMLQTKTTKRYYQIQQRMNQQYQLIAFYVCLRDISKYKTS